MREKTKEQILSVGQTILVTVGSLGFVALAAGMGNAVQLLKYTPILKKRKIKVYELNRDLKRLIERGLIEEKEDQTHKFLRVTPAGQQLLLKYKLKGLLKEKPQKWDGKYRVIVFDILEAARNTRDRMRRMIKGFGFVCLQDSVWIYPYECQEIVELLKEYFHLKSQIIYMTVESIENDKWIKNIFKLK